MFLSALGRLRRYLSVYLSSNFSTLCFIAFRRVLFALSAFYGIWLYFEVFRKFFRRVFLICFFYSGAEDQRARRTSLRGLYLVPCLPRLLSFFPHQNQFSRVSKLVLACTVVQCSLR